MFQTLRNAFKVPELRNKLLFVGLILILYRIGAVMPVPFVDSQAMNAQLEMMGSGSFFNYMNILSGSAFGYGTLFALSVSPYITSSIVLQLLDVAFPRWFGGPTADPQEKRKKMTVWTRVITILLAILTAWGYYAMMKNYGVLDTQGETLLGAIVIIVCYCAGAALIMWLAEKIEEKGIGNGISLILLANILSSAPNVVSSFITMIQNGFADKDNPTFWGIFYIVMAVLSLAATLAIVMFVIWITGSERRIPVKYAKRVVGRKMYGGQSSHLPLKVNMSGVMPVIFASSIISLPVTIISLFGAADHKFWKYVYAIFSPLFNPNSVENSTTVSGAHWLNLFYMLLLFLLILGFSYFYVTISFDPNEVANNLQKQGGQIPGIRQGTPTAEYIKKILSKITLMGAFFLSFIAIFPPLVSWVVTISGGTFANIAFGGTSMLIVIGVIQETTREIEAQLTMRNYKGFLN